MAPPGFHPPSYGGIPPAYLNKSPPPKGADTNTRAYAIFFSYLALCLSLTLFIIQRLLRSYTVLAKSHTARPPPRKHVFLFAGLAAGSLLTTWYYMIQYFNVSYKWWMMWRSYYELGPEHMHWGLWLKETSLFKEAWEVVIVGNARYWWSHQIFFFACGLGLLLEQRGIPRGIKHTWAFMLLGQIVAISFATNLFILNLLLSPPAPPAPARSGFKKKWIGPWLINFVAIIATEIPVYILADEHYWEKHNFFPVLMVPHIALMVAPFARVLLPGKYFSDDDVEFADSIYSVLWKLTLGGGIFLWLKVTATAYSYGGFYGIYSALTEHPAVSSVGFDVICCWISWSAYWMLTKKGVVDVVGKGSDEDGWEGAGSGTTVTSGDVGGAVRRR